MNVAQQISILQKAIDELKQLDPEATLEGHIIYQVGRYSGDLSGAIFKTEVEQVEEDNGSILGVYVR